MFGHPKCNISPLFFILFASLEVLITHPMSYFTIIAEIIMILPAECERGGRDRAGWTNRTKKSKILFYNMLLLFRDKIFTICLIGFRLNITKIHFGPPQNLFVKSDNIFQIEFVLATPPYRNFFSEGTGNDTTCLKIRFNYPFSVFIAIFQLSCHFLLIILPIAAKNGQGEAENGRRYVTVFSLLAPLF